MQYKLCNNCMSKIPRDIKGNLCNNCSKERYKAIKQYKRENNIVNKEQKIYNKNIWRRVKNEAIKRAKGLCEVCYTFGINKPGDEVHHIVKIKDGDNSTHYDIDNLVYVCKKCHKAIEGLDKTELIKYLELGGE